LQFFFGNKQRTILGGRVIPSTLANIFLNKNNLKNNRYFYFSLVSTNYFTSASNFSFIFGNKQTTNLGGRAPPSISANNKETRSSKVLVNHSAQQSSSRNA
jgi:hypothetical protein